MPDKVAIIGNGVILEPERVAEKIRGFEIVVAVDGGLIWLDQMGIQPDLILGDLDSVSEELLGRYLDVEVRRYPTEKDESDMELAILQFPNDQVTLFGAFGRRIDHSLYNMALLRRFPTIRIEDGEEEAFVLTKEATLNVDVGQLISLIPLSDEVRGVTTKGLKWELVEQTLSSELISLSNVALQGQVAVALSAGELLVVLN